MMRAVAPLCIAAAMLGLSGPALAEASTGANIAHFRKVCLANAPAFDSAAIEAAAQKEIYRAGDATASASVHWKQGKSCSLRARVGASLAPVVSAVEADPIVLETMKRLGGGEITMKRVKTKGLQYRFTTPAGRFEMSFTSDYANQSFNFSKL